MAPKAPAKKKPAKKAASPSAPQQIPFVNYLVLGKTPYLRAFECTNCGARFLDRRNACANCFATAFKKVRIKNTGVVTSFAIVMQAKEPFVSATVDCDGTMVACTLLDVEPNPEHVKLGMKVKLKTYSMGKDAEGTEAIGFGFAPA